MDPKDLQALLKPTIKLLQEAKDENRFDDNVLLSPDWFERAKAELQRLKDIYKTQGDL